MLIKQVHQKSVTFVTIGVMTRSKTVLVYKKKLFNLRKKYFGI